MAATYLDEIIAHHRARAAADRRDWRARMEGAAAAGPSLREALAGEGHVRVIAEVKRRSPSRGWLARDADAAELAGEYEKGGAAAISVLTDSENFGGSAKDLADVRAAVSLPILRKDFTVAPNDVVDAAEMGATAVLLIVAALEDVELALLSDVAQRCGLDALVEVHDGAEAARAVDSGATLIGVNQRDLHSFEVDARRAAAVMSDLPRGVVTVAESGMSSVADVERAAQSGFDAVLVGEAFVTAADPASAVRRFSAVAKVGRA